MVLRARDARELVDLAEQQRVPLVIGYPYHFVEHAVHVGRGDDVGAMDAADVECLTIGQRPLMWMFGRSAEAMISFNATPSGPCSVTG